MWIPIICTSSGYITEELLDKIELKFITRNKEISTKYDCKYYDCSVYLEDIDDLFVLKELLEKELIITDKEEIEIYDDWRE